MLQHVVPWIGLIAIVYAAPLLAQTSRPVRTFPQFVGTWVLDESASTGRLGITPRIATTVTIAISPTEITLTKQLRLGPSDRVPGAPPPEVYRLDGTETWLTDTRTGAVLDRGRRFTLAADMLVLTEKTGGRVNGPFTLVTDAYVVDGDVLTLHRQLASITAAGEVLLMQDPANNFRHTYIYRRVP